MQAALSGFFTIGLIVAVGFVAAHLGALTGEHQRALTRIAFHVGSPALLMMLMWRADLVHVFARTLGVSVLAIASAGLAYVLVAARLWRPVPPGGVIGLLLSCYTNAGNLGLPIAAYVLGDMTWMAPIMLLQIGLMQPAALAYLDLYAARTAGRAPSLTRALSMPVRNPITVGVLAGVTLNLLRVEVLPLLATPLDMVGAVAVPAMLIAFGVSLRLDPRPSRDPDAPEAWGIVAIKMLLHPVVAFLLARYAFALPAHQVLAVTVIAALPPAQNIFVIASTYAVRPLLARDVTFVATLASVPSILVISALLG